MRFSIFILIIIVCTSCTESSSEQTSIPSQEQQTIVDVPIITTKYNTWESFWAAFQAAVKAQDKDEIKALSIFGENWSESTFEKQYELYIDTNMQQRILATTATEVPLSEILEISKAVNLREIMFSESSIEEGIEYESALILYFGKVEEQYGLVMWMAAG